MIVDLLVFCVGLVILYFGAEWLIEGAAAVALRFGIRPMVVGLTVVALGTSMPEFVVNLFASFGGQDGLALGNIVGSNICNIGLIVGLSAVIVPLSVSPPTLKKEYPLVMAAMVLFYLLAFDQQLSFIDGVILILGLVGFLLFLVIDARRSNSTVTFDETVPANEEEMSSISMRKKTILIIGGIVGLAIGARLMVTSAVSIAEALNVNETVIGLTVVALGTSLPELAASVVGANRGEMDMCIGNVLGSNMLNILFVIGMLSIVRPLQVDPLVISLHIPVMLGFGLLLFPLARTQYEITRVEGAGMLVVFASYITYLVLPYTSW